MVFEAVFSPESGGALQPVGDGPRLDSLPAPRKDVAHWIAAQFRDIPTISQRVEITSPSEADLRVANADLGDIRVKLTTDATSIRCHFVCAENGTDIVLRSNIDTLIDDLQRLGYKDVRASFAMADQSSGGRHHGGTQGNTSRPPHPQSPLPDHGDTEPQQTPLQAGPDDTMDIRI